MMVLDAQGPTLNSAPKLPGRSIWVQLKVCSCSLQKLFRTFAPYFSYLKIKIPCSPSSSSMRFIVSGLTFRSLIHFEFIFVYGVRKCPSFILLQVVDQFSQHHLLKRLFLIHCIFLPPLSKIKCPYVRGFISGLSILFH